MLKNSNITQIDDIVEVVDDEVPTLNTGQAKVIKREVVNVVTINSFKSCHYCNAKSQQLIPVLLLQLVTTVIQK